MRFERALPLGDRLVYGFDAAPGVRWFGELHDKRGRVVASYDVGSRSYNHEAPLRALMVWLGHASDLFDEDDLNEVLELLMYESREDLPPYLHFVAEIVCNLQAAARAG